MSPTWRFHTRHAACVADTRAGNDRGAGPEETPRPLGVVTRQYMSYWPIFFTAVVVKEKHRRVAATPGNLAYFYTPLLPCGNDACVAAVREPLRRGVDRCVLTSFLSKPHNTRAIPQPTSPSSTRTTVDSVKMSNSV